MATRQQVIQEARRLLCSADVAADALRHVHTGAAERLGQRIESLESLSPGLEALQGRASATPARYERAGAVVRAAAPVAEAILQERALRIADGVEAMKKLDLGRDDEVTPQEQTGLEAIILLTGRPAILIQEGDFMEPPPTWAGLKHIRAEIRTVIERVGRIEVAGNPNFDWLGTGFLAGRDVVVTNRHVAMEFSRSAPAGGWIFRPPMTSSIDFKAELGSGESLEFKVLEIVGIHDEHDLAVLRVEQVSGAAALPDPLPVSAAAPATLERRQVYVVGYPAWDGRRNDPEPMRRIFSEIYNVKRLQPGEISGELDGAFEISHDCSTLGGNSGSPVIDLQTHRVLGLHFGGRFMQKNRAVPLWRLQNDPLVKQARLNFQ